MKKGKKINTHIYFSYSFPPLSVSQCIALYNVLQGCTGQIGDSLPFQRLNYFSYISIVRVAVEKSMKDETGMNVFDAEREQRFSICQRPMARCRCSLKAFLKAHSRRHSLL